MNGPTATSNVMIGTECKSDFIIIPSGGSEVNQNIGKENDDQFLQKVTTLMENPVCSPYDGTVLRPDPR